MPACSNLVTSKFLISYFHAYFCSFTHLAKEKRTLFLLIFDLWGYDRLNRKLCTSSSAPLTSIFFKLHIILLSSLYVRLGSCLDTSHTTRLFCVNALSICTQIIFRRGSDSKMSFKIKHDSRYDFPFNLGVS